MRVPTSLNTARKFHTRNSFSSSFPTFSNHPIISLSPGSSHIHATTMEDFNRRFDLAIKFYDNSLQRNFLFTARQSYPNNIGFCYNWFPITRCSPSKWLYSFKIRQNNHIWWVRDCRVTFYFMNGGGCSVIHIFNSIVCFTVRCP